MLPDPAGGRMAVTVETTGGAEIARMGMSADDVPYNIVMMFLLAVVFRILALLCLYMRLVISMLRTRRNKKLIEESQMSKLATVSSTAPVTAMA
jgi:hypothetical protein